MIVEQRSSNSPENNLTALPAGFEEVVEIFKKHTQYDDETLKRDAVFESDLGIDSITLLSILKDVAGCFEIDIEVLRQSQFVCMNDLIGALSELKTAENHTPKKDNGCGATPVRAAMASKRPPEAAPTPPHAQEGAPADDAFDDRQWLLTFIKENFNGDFKADETFQSQGVSNTKYLKLLRHIEKNLNFNPTIELKNCDTLEKIKTFLDAAAMHQTVSLAKTKAGATLSSISDSRTMQDFYEVRHKDLFEKVRQFNSFYRQQKKASVYWYGMPTLTASKNRVVFYDELKGQAREFIMMGSNNYLGLANHPKVIEAINNANKKYGATNTGSRIIGGTNTLHKTLEERLAAFKATESAIVFPSGYSANLGAISALARRNDLVVTDKYNHMSISDGCKLSGAAVKIYQHNDMQDLEKILRNSESDYDGKLIVTDGVFSMHGDLCRLDDIVRLAETYKAKVLVDDAHSTGVMGRRGTGTSEHFDLKGKVDIELGTFSKTLSGVGGFVCASEEVVEYLRFYAHSYVFAATIPAGVAAGLISCLEIMESEPERLQQLWKNISYLKSNLMALGFDIGGTQSAIIPIVIGNYEKTLAIGRFVRSFGLFCQTVVYPGVGLGDERLRLSLSCEHTREDLDMTLEILEKAGRRHDLLP